MKTFLTSAQLAKRWGLSHRTIEDWRTEKKGPPWLKLGSGPGSAVIYKLSEIEKWETKNTITPSTRRSKRAV